MIIIYENNFNLYYFIRNKKNKKNLHCKERKLLFKARKHNITTYKILNKIFELLKFPKRLLYFQDLFNKKRVYFAAKHFLITSRFNSAF